MHNFHKRIVFLWQDCTLLVKTNNFFLHNDVLSCKIVLVVLKYTKLSAKLKYI